MKRMRRFDAATDRSSAGRLTCRLGASILGFTATSFTVTSFTVLSLAVLSLTILSCGPRPEAHGAEAKVAETPSQQTAENASQVPVRPLTTVRTLTLVERTTVEHSQLPAETRPLRQATVAAEVPGTVESMAVREGQRVTSGQTLAQIDGQALSQRVDEAEAIAGQRRAQLERAENLLARQSITQDQYLDAKTAHEVAAARLASLRLDLSKAKVEAPWAGTVARRHIEVGDYVQPGQPLFDMMDLRRLKVVAPAPSREVPLLRLGGAVEVTFESLPGEILSGQIEHLAVALDSSARTLDVEVEIDNRHGRLRPGMLGQLRIPLRTWQAVVLLPLHALVEMGDGQVVYVFTDEDEANRGRVRRRKVLQGPILGDEVVIVEGLRAGEQVIVDGQHQVADGQTVRRLGPES